MSGIEVVGEIHLEPQEKMCFNAPFVDTKMQTVAISNMTSKRIGWRAKSSNTTRVTVDPPFGLLEPRQKRLISVTCAPFDAEKESLEDDRITIEYTEVLNPKASRCSDTIFKKGNSTARRKTLKIEYNW
uniref:Major sperm protein n=1 Tax=Trichuris muris TaxID=70415 RepID=A0A5S6QJB2_TRIMR